MNEFGEGIDPSTLGGPPLETMCDMVQRKAKFDELAGVASGAKFMCIECARSAGEAKRLCDPKPLP